MIYQTNRIIENESFLKENSWRYIYIFNRKYVTLIMSQTYNPLWRVSIIFLFIKLFESAFYHFCII